MAVKSVKFQALKWEVDTSEENLCIYIHGLSDKDKKVTVKVPDFKPHVYLELDQKIKWNNTKIQLLKTFLRKNKINPLKCEMVQRNKNYYYKEGKFLWMCFDNYDEKLVKLLRYRLNKIHNIFYWYFF